MKILHVVEDFSSSNTGITAVVCQQTAWQVQCYEWVGIFATGASDIEAPPGVKCFFDESFVFPRSWRKTHGLEDRLTKLVCDNGVQVVHIHGLWRAATLVAQKVCVQQGINTVLTVHGQLEPWALYQQGVFKKWKKIMYWHLVAKPVLKYASVLQAITISEQRSLRKILPAIADVLLPNAINLDEIPTEQSLHGQEGEARVIVFLGRLHPVKGIDILIRAFSHIAVSSDWRLIIAGPEEIPAYASKLKQMVRDPSVASQIEFIGPVYDAVKWQLLASAWVVAVPSHSEVVGVVNLEAASVNTPSITTVQTGLLDWQDGGGLLVEPREYDLRQALLQAMSWSVDERLERGRQSKRLVENCYSLQAVKKKWKQLYNSLEQVGK